MSSSRRTHESKPRISLKQRAASLRAKAQAVTRKPNVTPLRMPDPPADLAAACAWAIEHRAWLDHAGLSDDEMAAEIARGDAVFRRAAAEPSRGLPDLVAKARMLLNDLVEMDSLDDESPDQRLTRVVLRELTALELPPPAGPSDPDTVAAGFGLSGLSLGALMALHGVAGELRGHCSALQCQPRCTDASVHPFGRLTAAGLLVDWVYNVVDSVRDRVQVEARARTATDQWEREARLSIIAPATIANDDRADLLALIADLTSFVADDH